MTTLTLPLLVVMVVFSVRRGAYPWALAVAGATPIGAALVIAGTPIATFYFAALGVVVALVGDAVARRRVGKTAPSLGLGYVMLWMFVGWATIVTLVAPILFPGLLVSMNSTIRALQPGLLTTSNIAQLIYLVLGVLVVAYVARNGTHGVRLIGVTCITTTLLSLWRLAAVDLGVWFPEGFFDNSPTVSYIETTAQGTARFRGILSEPASLANTCLVTIAFVIALLPRTGAWKRVGLLLLAAGALWMGFQSTSTTFIIAGVVLIAIAVTARLLGTVHRGMRVSRLAFVAVLGLIATTPLWLQRAIGSVTATVVQKQSSDSYSARNSADTQAYDILRHSLGLGVGVGSDRPSSFLAGVLVATGLVGAVLFFGATAAIVLRAIDIASVRPAVWVLTVLLTTRLFAGPDLADSTGLWWMCLGVMISASLDRRRRRGAPPISNEFVAESDSRAGRDSDRASA